MNKLTEKIASWFTRREKKEVNIVTPAPDPTPEKKMGRGAYFKNNRKPTRGRNIQYVPMADGRTRIIKHETV